MRLRKGVIEAELDEELLRRLRFAEVFSRREFQITSGYREGDERCHGVGKAVDIACRDADDRYRIVEGLLRAGFVRILLYTAHIHADVCTDGYQQKILGLGGASK